LGCRMIGSRNRKTDKALFTKHFLGIKRTKESLPPPECVEGHPRMTDRLDRGSQTLCRT
jgi:hypothetical protein